MMSPYCWSFAGKQAVHTRHVNVGHRQVDMGMQIERLRLVIDHEDGADHAACSSLASIS